MTPTNYDKAEQLEASIEDLKTELAIAATSKRILEQHLAEAQANYDAAVERHNAIADKLFSKEDELDAIKSADFLNRHRTHADRVVTEIMMESV